MAQKIVQAFLPRCFVFTPDKLNKFGGDRKHRLVFFVAPLRVLAWHEAHRNVGKSSASSTVVPPDRPQPMPAVRAGSSLWNRPGLLALGLVLVTLIVFLRAVEGGFVDYDDADYVTANAQVQAGLTWAGVRWAFTTGHASNWHPLTWLSHMLDAQLYGLTPAGHHLTSVAFHAVNAGLVFLVLWNLTGAAGRSLTAAALFALHPLRVESVAWISERKDVLSLFFGLLALLAYARFAAARSKVNTASAAPDRWRGWGAYGLALLCFALSLLSKPMWVTLPFLLLLLDYWPLRRGGASVRVWGRLVMEKLPFFALTVASSLVTFWVQQRGGAVASVTGLPLRARLENAGVAYGRYLLKALWPADLAPLYPHPGFWPTDQVVVAALVVIGISLLVIARRRPWPYAFVGWFWFVGTLVPVIGLVQVGIQSLADRYTYLPGLGLILALVWGAQSLMARWRIPPLTIAFGVLALAATCAVLTWRQIRFWRDSERLFSRAVAVTKNNYLAHNNLGFYFAQQGRLPEAIAQYETSLRIKPDYEDALNNLGHALAGQGRHAEALPYYEAALRVRPRHVEVNNNYGNALANLGRLEEAIRHYEIALRENPQHADTHNNLGIALAQQGCLEAARDHLQEAVRLRPQHAGSHSNLGNVLAALGRLDAAAGQYRQALRLQPDDAQAHNNLGNVFAEQGKLEAAARQYQRALELNPHNPETHFNLALLRARQGRLADALRQVEETLRLQPDHAAARRQRALWQAAPR